MEEIWRFSVYFSGHVQGVGFRRAAQRLAIERGLRGFVKNLPDGRVEMVMEGDAERIMQVMAALREKFDITDVETHDGLGSGEFSGFEIQH